MSCPENTQEAQRPIGSRFTVLPTLGDLIGAALDMEEVAARLHDAGFEVIPVGGVRVLDKFFDDDAKAKDYVSSCVAAIGGQLVGRKVHDGGRIQLRVCVPSSGGTKDRTKEPDVLHWTELPFDLTWWRNREIVALPSGWASWGKAKNGKVITERRGSGERNVGVRTGTSAGLVVVDIDRKDGRDGLAALREKFGAELDALFPSTFSVQTPTGGLHWYYESDAPITNSASLVAHGVDVRGEGGYVVGPRSMRMDGGRYQIVNCVPPAPLPEETTQFLLSLRPARKGRTERRKLTALPKEEALEKLLEKYGEVPDGQRHDVLVRAAGMARNLIEDDSDLEWVIKSFAERRGVADREHDDLDRIVDDAKKWERRAADGAKSIIIVDLDEARVVREFEEAMARAPDLFQRGQQLTTVIEPKASSKSKHPTIAPVARAVLRTWSTDLVEWMVIKIAEGEDGEKQEMEVPIRPPGWAVSALHAQRRWPNVDWLEAVVDFPVLLPDGSVLATPGYESESGLYLAGKSVAIAVVDKPRLGDAQRALEQLTEIYCDFPFADEASRSAAVAGILTPLARYAFDGPVPMFAIDKSVRGTGGSLMADCVGVLLTGHTMPRMIQAPNEEEQRKVITSLMLEGAPLVLLDNISNTLGTAALDALLTSTSWKDRLLGVNEMVCLPNNATIYATGNNLAFQGDTSRRALRIRLQSELENPEDRSDFRHPDLLAWIARERSRLLGAALTLLRAYVLAGRPDQDLKPWGSFESWSALVRGCLVWAGWADPAGARATADDELDGDKQTLIDLILGLESISDKLTAREIFEKLRQSAPVSASDMDPFPGLRAVLTGSNGRLLPPKLITAGFLRKFKGRVWDGKAIVSEKDRTKTSRWFVRSLGPKDVTADESPVEATSAGREPMPPAKEPNGDGDAPMMCITNYLELIQ